MLKLKKKSIEWALKSINRHHDTYIFPPPFEFNAINEYKDEVVTHITSIDLLEAGLREYRTALTPKSVKGFRISTQLDPLDTICSHAIIYELSTDFERNRIPKSENIVHSFRLNPKTDGLMYDENYSWDSFKQQAIRNCTTGNYSYILVTDISDFYPSIYLHDIETVLYEAVKPSGKQTHVKVLINYIKAMHLSQTHKGIPVGPQFSRPIAELVLDEIDRILIKKKIKYCRYVDDYYVFCKSEKEAYKNLSEIAQILYDRRGLKLNEKKTEIITVDRFMSSYLLSPGETVKKSIIQNLYDLLDEIGVSRDPYSEIDTSKISKKDWQRIQECNLELILDEQLAKNEPDSFLVSFLLLNLARFDNTRIADKILKEQNIIKIFPKMRSIVSYLERVRSFSPEQHKEIGKKVIKIIIDCYISTIPFNRIWLLHLFTLNNEWNNIKELESLFETYHDPLTERELYLALGRAHNYEYFRNNKDKNLDIDSWRRRSFIASMSTLPKDERVPWFNSRKYRSRDFLEKIVEKWVTNNPF